MSPSGVGADRAGAAHVGAELREHQRGAARRARRRDPDLLDQLRRPGPRGSPRPAAPARRARARPSRSPSSIAHPPPSARPRPVAARDRRLDDRLLLRLVEHARRARSRARASRRRTPTRAARWRSTAPRGRRRSDRAVVRHQRRGAPLERVEHGLGQLGRAERRVRAPRAPRRRAAASGSGRTAARRARSDSAVAIGAWVCTTAPAPKRRRPRVQVELGGRRELALDDLPVEVDDRHLIGLELGQHRAGRRDRDVLAGARADVSRRADTSPAPASRRAAAATCSRSLSSMPPMLFERRRGRRRIALECP